MWRRRVALVAFVFFSALALFGCASFPAEDLKTYAAAFQETRAAGYILLDKVSPIVAEAERLRGTSTDSCILDRSRTPRCFDPRQVRAGGGRAEPKSITIRRVALDLIAGYNSVLVDLAEGKSEAAVRSQVGDLADLAGDFVSLFGIGGALPALIPVLKPQVIKFAELFEHARITAVARSSIVENQDVIKSLIGALEHDTVNLYSFYRLQRLREWNQVIDNDRQAAQAIIEDINAFHVSLFAYVALLRKTSTALDTLVAAAIAGQAPTTQNLREVIKEATEIRGEAKTFWDTIRKVREPAR